MTESRKEGTVQVISVGDGGVNALGAATRRDLVEAITEGIADADVTAIVLTGRNGHFSAGADISELGTDAMHAAPSIYNVLDVMEACPKPLIAAIDGTCLGGGLELALTCHYRVAAANARIGFPEINIGLLPGAGGTQRLPRVVGVEKSLNMILSGKPSAARNFEGSSLFDIIVPDDPVSAAIRLAETKAAKHAEGEALPLVRHLTIDDPDAPFFLGFARSAMKGHGPQYHAHQKCVEAIEAAVTISFDDGIVHERELFTALTLTPESRALRHIFLAGKAAAKIPDVPENTAARPIKTAAVIGAGTMGTGIALAFLNAGIPVTLLDIDQQAIDSGADRIRETYSGLMKKGRMTDTDASAALSRLNTTMDYDAMSSADIIVEAAFEDMDIKKKIFTAIDQVAKPDAILATNTSTLDVDNIAGATKRPENVIGTHFFSPANVMKLLEVVRGQATSKEVLKTTMRLARTLGKTAVVSGVCDGFIGNRMIDQYLRQAFFMIEEGASPSEVDKAIEAFGFAMGPFRMSDLAGNDIPWQVRKRKAKEQPEVINSAVADKLCELGRFGQKTMAGWYDYKPGDRKVHESPVVADLINEHRKSIDIKPRKIKREEIVDRLVLALINEGAQILDEGIALRSSDIDVVYVMGYGFPAWRGGPMFYADELSIFEVARRMRELARNPNRDPAFWTPSPLITRLVEDGATLSSVGVSR